MKERRNVSASSNNNYSSPMFQGQQYGRMSMADPDSSTDGSHEFHKAALYILGDKTQMKVGKFFTNFFIFHQYNTVDLDVSNISILKFLTSQKNIYSP